MTTKSAAYWEGRNAEAARIAFRERARSALDAHPNLSDLASEVAKQLGRDNAIKQRIFARSPGVFSAMDAEEFGRASSVELAARELKELGIEPGDNDPLAILDAHHAGRQFARDYLIPGNTLTGGNRIAGNNGNKLIGGSASDSADSFVDKYLGS
jgi:hypothetical protein